MAITSKFAHLFKVHKAKEIYEAIIALPNSKIEAIRRLSKKFRISELPLPYIANFIKKI